MRDRPVFQSMAAALALGAVVVLAPPVQIAVRAEPAAPVGPKLTPKLKDLLRQEMAQISGSMREIGTAIATGDHETVADHAARVAAGFILKRSLTAQDKKDLKSAVPPAFLQLDATFHKTAEKLIEAARNRDSAREGEHFSTMMENCVGCHATYAADKFPGLRK